MFGKFPSFNLSEVEGEVKEQNNKIRRFLKLVVKNLLMQAFKMSSLCFESEGMAVLIPFYSILANTRNGCGRTKIGYFD